jgi:transposase
MIEAAWHPPYRRAQPLRRRWDAASPAARARGQAANRRLHARRAGFDERKKRSVVANPATARELAGWCWSLAVLQD